MKQTINKKGQYSVYIIPNSNPCCQITGILYP